ncbi:MAG: class I SAM-dependent methyltransferase [Deltaproteobacteria bacterium]|nr:class I SAM-dependent methyltransferase [Deltaproteobacteria bacterium]
MKTLFLILALALLAAPAPAQAPHESHNDRYVDPDLDVDRMVDRFENESREVFALREALVAAAGIQPGDVVADVGAGTGAFLDPLAGAVGKTGHVVVVEISIRFVEHLRKVADEAGYDNVTAVFSSYTSATLPPASVDKIVLIDTYHHFDDYESMLGSMLDALRSGGEMTVVDFDRREDSREWVQGHVRAPRQTFRKEIEAVGFEFVEEVAIEGMVENFLFRFRKP